MAATWIKMRSDLAEDPAVIGIAARLGVDEFSVVGRLQCLWSWADSQSRDGHARGVTTAWINRKVQRDGFAEAMVQVGWLEVTEDGITFPNFENHNGETAKSRALSSNRKQKERVAKTKRARVTQESRDMSRLERDKSVTREEKIRVDKESPPSPPSVGGRVTTDENPTGQLAPTPAGEVCRLIRAAGVADVNPSHPELLELLGKGVTIGQFEAAAKTAADKGKGMAYLLAIVVRQLQDAAKIAAGPAMPTRPWDESRSTIEATGDRMGLGRWDEAAFQRGRGEPFREYEARVRAAVNSNVGAVTA